MAKRCPVCPANLDEGGLGELWDSTKSFREMFKLDKMLTALPRGAMAYFSRITGDCTYTLYRCRSCLGYFAACKDNGTGCRRCRNNACGKLWQLSKVPDLFDSLRCPKCDNKLFASCPHEVPVKPGGPRHGR